MNPVRLWRIVACVSYAEHERVLAMAKARNLTVSRLICRAINALLVADGDSTAPLADCGVPGPKPKQER